MIVNDNYDDDNDDNDDIDNDDDCQVLNMLLREPVLQDRRAEHVRFQKHAHELMERVSGPARYILYPV